jgi:hypothetical protein
MVAADRRISLASGEDTLEVHEAMKEAATITAFQNSIWAIRNADRLCSLSSAAVVAGYPLPSVIFSVYSPSVH